MHSLSVTSKYSKSRLMDGRLRVSTLTRLRGFVRSHSTITGCNLAGYDGLGSSFAIKLK